MRTPLLPVSHPACAAVHAPACTQLSHLRHPPTCTPLHLLPYNRTPTPAGAGSSCEGEDWEAEGMLPSVDALTMHVYWRQTEGVPEQASGACCCCCCCCWPHMFRPWC